MTSEFCTRWNEREPPLVLLQSLTLGPATNRYPLAPLLEPKRRASRFALLPEPPYPIRVHRPRSESALAAHHDPIKQALALSAAVPHGRQPFVGLPKSREPVFLKQLFMERVTRAFTRPCIQ